MPSLPSDVIEWIRGVFRECNHRITRKLGNSPNLPEESLDLTWIEHLSHFSSPVSLPSKWTVQIETHFLGGLRHWHGWEIADIGLLLFAQLDSGESLNKVALLQSKRLYPKSGAVEEETRGDYEIGFGRLADPEVIRRPIDLTRDFEFDSTCSYGALLPQSSQVKAIADYQKQTGLKVYYQLYNPWTIPFVQRIPLRGEPKVSGDLSHGVRIIQASGVHGLLRGKPKSYRPTIKDLASIPGIDDDLGWRLETFISDEWLGCREGNAFDSADEFPIQSLFLRRTGPISAAISIRVQSPNVLR